MKFRTLALCAGLCLSQAMAAKITIVNNSYIPIKYQQYYKDMGNESFFNKIRGKKVNGTLQPGGKVVIGKLRLKTLKLKDRNGKFYTCHHVHKFYGGSINYSVNILQEDSAIRRRTAMYTTFTAIPTRSDIFSDYPRVSKQDALKYFNKVKRSEKIYYFLDAEKSNDSNVYLLTMKRGSVREIKFPRRAFDLQSFAATLKEFMKRRRNVVFVSKDDGTDYNLLKLPSGNVY